MSFVEFFVSQSEVATKIEELSKLGLKLISKRKTNHGVFLQFEIPDEVGFGA